jgi:hypothetical protein
MNRWTRIMLVAVLVVGAPVACSDDDGPSSSPATTASTAGEGRGDEGGGAGDSGTGTISFEEWQELVNPACAVFNQQAVALSVDDAQQAQQLAEHWEAMTTTIRNTGLPNRMTTEAETWLADIDAIGDQLDQIVAAAQNGSVDPALSNELEGSLRALSDESQELGVDECSSNNTQAGGTGGAAD